MCSGPHASRPFDFFFVQTVDSDNHYVLCIPMDPPEAHPVDDDSEIDVLPVIFTIIGQIAPEECFLTTAGDEREDRPDHARGGPLASCWMESRADRSSCLEWRQLPSAIEHVASAAVAGEPLNTSRVLRFAPNDGAVQLRVRFVPNSGELKDTLPVFDNDANTRCAPDSADEIPFNKPFRAMFTLEYVIEGTEKYLFADLFSLDSI
ncbi:uncharacterized protein TRAVEDRAFT_46229 [Trametes versicolor FP-101664 SS1]|uniref:uncharacterized protein n=1 Tax=Trametes versicolor (strain FP-101664) TaxID=717944 RepID=UPI00046231A7|nr:uncharacterized protein TRAVEDRAFT_46229 [Trametes versicolor FP-101664 SS1]EIW61002.1 hypothetical protein TRAVEDRAFT_46229 [Trametes versicolor FP-101664 SS1]